MLLKFNKCNKFGNINVSFHLFQNFILFTFSIMPSVANAKFSLLKLLIYEPYLLCLSRLECQA
jgi:hypothetical protein